ncbi:MAG: hypothetical protein ACREDT_05580 [Methylocella sp.]
MPDVGELGENALFVPPIAFKGLLLVGFALAFDVEQILVDDELELGDLVGAMLFRLLEDKRLSPAARAMLMVASSLSFWDAVQIWSSMSWVRMDCRSCSPARPW